MKHTDIAKVLQDKAVGQSVTVCGWVRNIGREEESHGLLPLSRLRDMEADMFTTVFVGSSATRRIGARMVTPRGYRQR